MWLPFFLNRETRLGRIIYNFCVLYFTQITKRLYNFAQQQWEKNRTFIINAHLNSTRGEKVFLLIPCEAASFFPHTSRAFNNPAWFSSARNANISIRRMRNTRTHVKISSIHTFNKRAPVVYNLNRKKYNAVDIDVEAYAAARQRARIAHPSKRHFPKK